MEQGIGAKTTSNLWIYGPFQTERHAPCGHVSTSSWVR